MGSAVQLHVVLTENWAEKRRYISLNHIWGSNTTVKLTKEMYDAYQYRIPTEDLSRKYIDAIQHGHCNISAASSISANEGLFYERDAARARPHVIVPGNNLDPAVVKQRMDGEWYSPLDKEPLYSRGWVCQERLLSTRNVSFARHLVYFECVKEMGSELPDVEDGGQEGSLRNRNTDLNEQLFSLRTLREHRNPHDAWKAVVEFYSGCDQTYPTDKLVALPGVAQIFHERIKSTYLAGIWSNNFLEGLAWQRSRYSTHPKTKNTEYLAPSWSWVSVNVQVEYSYSEYGFQSLVECEEVNTVPHGTDPFGRVQSGSLRLRCYPIPLLLDYGKILKHTECKGWEFGWLMDTALNTFISEVSYGDHFSCTLDATCTMDDHKVHQFAAGVKYYTVPLLTEFDPGVETSFLILEPLTPTWGLYRRLGLCNHSSSLPLYYDHDDNNNRNSDMGGDMPAICQEGLSLGMSFQYSRVLAHMIRALQEAFGRCLIAII